MLSIAQLESAMNAKARIILVYQRLFTIILKNLCCILRRRINGVTFIKKKFGHLRG